MTSPPAPGLGTLSRDGAQVVVRFERELHHPRGKVWSAITESEHLEHWLPCDIVGERRSGAGIELPFWPRVVEEQGEGMTPVLTGRIDVWDPPAVFDWWWSTERLRFELEDVDGGTLLRLTTWLSPDGAGAVKTSTGYHVCLDALTELLDRGEVPESVGAYSMDLEAEYQIVADRLDSGTPA
jgi:uncharacterized protein YndB with AHSA1/START domain